MIEYFDERSTEFITKTADIDLNYRYLSYIQHHLTELNKVQDLRLNIIYNTLGIPFPDNYLLDYKLKKNQPVFEFEYDKKLGKIKIDIDVPDQPVLKDTGDTMEYTFTLHKED